MPSVPTRKDTRGFFGRCWIGAYFWPRHSLRQPLSPRRTPPKILTVPWGRCTNPCRSFLLILRFKPKVGEGWHGRGYRTSRKSSGARGSSAGHHILVFDLDHGVICCRSGLHWSLVEYRIFASS